LATSEQLVDALNDVFGKQPPGGRAAHAKGIVLTGTFKPADSASSVTVAPHLQKASAPITVRFSNTAGIMTIPDTEGLATPRGMAIRFHLPDGSETDLATHSYNGFPVANADDFRDLFVALKNSGPNAAKPTPLEVFLGSHPAAAKFLTSQPPPPVSYATLSYFGVNTFKFSNAQGTVKFGRYQIRPAAGEHVLSAEQVAKADPNYLSKEIRERVGRGAVSFKLRLQIAEPKDQLDDPSITWPDTRNTVDLGTVEISQAVGDSAAAERDLLFNPAAVPAGIEPQDPMIKVRSDAYLVSYRRREVK
jgi:catalase